MPSFVFLNVLAICLLGFLTSCTDLKFGRIENKFVFPAIAIAFALNLLNGFGWLPFLVNGLFAFLLGFALWTARLWAAGDSKLFLALALLFPLSLQEQTLFPGFSILVNSFLPAFALLLAIALFRTTSRQKAAALKEALKPSLVLSVAIFFFAFYWIFDYASAFFSIQFDLFTVSILIFALIALLEFAFPQKSVPFFALLSAAFLILRYEDVLNAYFLLFFFSFLVIAVFLLFFVLKLGFSCFGTEKKISELQPGMVLLEVPVKRGDRIVKKKPLLPSFANILLDAREMPFVEAGPKGLTMKDIGLLNEAMKQGKLAFETLEVQETVPFAPIIFIGTIISLLLPLLGNLF